MEKILADKLYEAVQNMLRYLAQTLNNRSAEIIASHFGLNPEGKSRTYEEIGKKYDITRQRVEQLRNGAMYHLKSHEVFPKDKLVIDEVKKNLDVLGSLLTTKSLEKEFMEKSFRNHAYFSLLVTGDLEILKEDEKFFQCWSTNSKNATVILQALNKLSVLMEDRDILSEERIIKIFSSFLGTTIIVPENKEIILRWLSASKEICKGPTGEWGKKNSPYIYPSGIADFAYIVLKRKEEPMHFNDIAVTAAEEFNVSTTHASCHNMLIKDDRFTWTGNGIYALKEWGQEEGFTIDIIRHVLKETPFLSQEQIVEKVMSKRSVKKQTIIIRLSENPELFKKMENGLYQLAEEETATVKG